MADWGSPLEPYTTAPINIEERDELDEYRKNTLFVDDQLTAEVTITAPTSKIYDEARIYGTLPEYISNATVEINEGFAKNTLIIKFTISPTPYSGKDYFEVMIYHLSPSIFSTRYRIEIFLAHKTVYTLSYNANEGTGPAPPTQTIASYSGDVSFVLEQNTFTRVNYNFTGWKKDNAGVIYTPESTILLTRPQPSAVMYAQWQYYAESPIIVVFEPSGGRFLKPDEYPDNVPLPSAIGEKGIFEYVEVPGIQGDPGEETTNIGKWVWSSVQTFEPNEVLQVTFINLPYSEATGLKPPSGVSSVGQWTLATPYTHSPENDPSTISLKLKRPTQDSICHKTVYPDWIPERGPQQRALLMAPSYGLIDLGNIQSIRETYTSKVTQIPICVYGYTGAFCMDLGNKKEVSLAYIRTAPQNPDDTSGDSRNWSNAKWVSMLKNIMNRWQMRTNGNLLYILRPNDERLLSGDSHEITTDPMRSYVDEIYGANCYITQLPIKYDQNPRVVSGSIELVFGTLYPKQQELPLSTISFGGEIRFTSSRWLSLPDPMSFWEFKPEVDFDGENFTADGVLYDYWIYNGNVRGNYGDVIDLRTVTKTGDVYVFTPHVYSSGKSKGILWTNSEQSQYVNIKAKSNSMMLWIGACGGGGGGGGWDEEKNEHYFPVSFTEYHISGGGGGGAGALLQGRPTVSVTPETTYTFTLSAGKGGAPGDNEAPGTAGGGKGVDSSVTCNNLNISYIGPGGFGGQGALGSWGDDAAQGGNCGDGSETYGKGGQGGQEGVYASNGLNCKNYSSDRGWGLGGDINGGEGSIRIGRDDPDYYRVIDRGGGGGGAEWFTKKGLNGTLTGYGGQGGGWQDTSNNRGRPDGILGGGGGGGGGGYYTKNLSGDPDRVYLFDAGKGGDGYAFICIISGGEFDQ